MCPSPGLETIVYERSESFVSKISTWTMLNNTNYLHIVRMLSSPRSTFTSVSARRFLSSTPRLRAAPPFASGPAPPRLPKEDQEIYEQLQRSSTGAFSNPKPSVVINQSPASSSPSAQPSIAQINQSPRTESAPVSDRDRELAAINARVKATGHGEELHADVRRGAKPEFEGDRNPKTGETGGPKNEPLRWGGNADWSYNGRVTDF